MFIHCCIFILSDFTTLIDSDGVDDSVKDCFSLVFMFFINVSLRYEKRFLVFGKEDETFFCGFRSSSFLDCAALKTFLILIFLGCTGSSFFCSFAL